MMEITLNLILVILYETGPNMPIVDLLYASFLNR